MMRSMPDAIADRLLLYAFFAWAVACVIPPIGILLQFVAIAYIAWKADIKGIPALMILVLGKTHLVSATLSGEMALKLGITISPAISFVLFSFFKMVKDLFDKRYDVRSMMFMFFWFLSLFPAATMAFEAKMNNLTGIWSSPIMEFLVPTVYFWGLSVAKSYEMGKMYFLKRLLVVFAIVELLMLVRIVNVFTFLDKPLMLSILFLFMKSKNHVSTGWKAFAFLGVFVALLDMLFGRRLQLIALGTDVAGADEYGSTFSRMGVFALTGIFIFWFSHRSQLNRLIPIILIVVNVLFVSYAINTQADESKRVAVTFQYETMEERFTAKLFGDRAAVWTMGWEEVKTPPYFIKDLRQFLVFDQKKGLSGKLLPHNQFLTLLGRHGWWLGLTLSIFIIWVWMRALKALESCYDDPVLYTVFVPAGLSIFFVVGITGQSVVGSNPWSNSIACLILPAIIYGVWQERRKMGYCV